MWYDESAVITMLFHFIFSGYDNIQGVHSNPFKSKLDSSNMLPLSNWMLIAEITLLARGIIGLEIFQNNYKAVIEWQQRFY